MAYFSEHYHSISGLHVALVAAFFFGVTRWILKLFPSMLLRLPLSKTSALVAVVAVIFYTFIVGLGVVVAWEELLAKDGIQNGTAESMEMDAPIILR
ncbi:MAG: ComEC/Rec2 family competence protein [Deltaproteobacteria bacterium]|nr:ComEC/Rec2 family competence protein [Deltaproteobacteria bacterium]